MELLWIGFWIVTIGVAIYSLREEKHCPKCRGELTEVGFEGWKKRCDDCGWKS